MTTIDVSKKFKTFLKTILFLERYNKTFLKIKTKKFLTHDNNRHVYKT